MVYEGFQRYGDVEVVNHERLAAYIAHGIVPTGLSVDVPSMCEGLAEVVTADGEYSTPLQDQAPWVDLDNPDTWDFAGVLSLEVTGVDDSTRTVAMTKTVRDGALPGSARRGPRTVGQTALLVARTTEGAQAGLAWLQRALHGSCEAAERDCGPAATLELFTACPTPITSTANTSVPPLMMNYRTPTDADNPTYDWTARSGDFSAADPDGTVLEPYTPDGYDGGTLTTETEELPLDGGGAQPLDFVISGGTAAPLLGNALLAGAAAMCTSGPVTITWTMRAGSPFGGVVQLVIVDDSGEAVEFGPKVELSDGERQPLVDYTWELPFGVDHDTWRPGIVASYPVIVQSVSTSVYPDTSPLDCVAPYQRFLPNTVTVTGPTVVQEIDAGCAVLLKVEWTWVAGSPYRYSSPRTVLAGLSSSTDPGLVLPGVSWQRRVATDLALVDNGDTTTGWSVSADEVRDGGYVYGTASSSVIVVSGTGRRLAARRDGVFSVATRRYIAVQWNGEGNVPPGGSPTLRVLAPGSTTPVATTLARDDTSYGGMIRRSVFRLPDSFGSTVAALLWTGTAAPAAGQRTVVGFDYITASSAALDTAATTSAAPWNCGPPAPELSCAADPCAPGFAAPPALPYVTDPARPRLTTQQVRDVSVCVGPEQTPANDGVFTFTLTASDQPVVGARIRVWDNVAGDCTVDDLCGFTYEYLIDYVPANGVLTIDGTDGTITTLCDGGAVLADASGSVAGDYGGPVKEPVARCNRRYSIRLQWLDTYPRTCAPIYTQGQAQGDLTLAVAVTSREG